MCACMCGFAWMCVSLKDRRKPDVLKGMLLWYESLLTATVIVCSIIISLSTILDKLAKNCPCCLWYIIGTNCLHPHHLRCSHWVPMELNKSDEWVIPGREKKNMVRDLERKGVNRKARKHFPSEQTMSIIIECNFYFYYYCYIVFPLHYLFS